MDWEGHIRSLISRPMLHLHVATRNLFSLLNFADLSCDCEEFSAVKGLRSARWIWSRDSDKEAGWLSSSSVSLTGYSPPSSWVGNTFTPLSNSTKKSNLLVFAFHTSYHSVGMLLGWYHFCVFCMNSTFEKGRNEFKKLSQPDRVFSASFLILLMLLKILSTSTPHQRCRRWYFSLT